MTELAKILAEDSLYPHPERLVPFLDNHDLVRFASEPGATPQGAKLAMAFLLTVRGMPQMYAGNEVYMEGWQDPDNRRDFAGFEGGEFGKARGTAQADVYAWTRDLLTLRSKTPALQTGSLQMLYASTDSIVYTRTEGKQRVLVALHRGAEDVTLHVRTQNTGAAGAESGTVLLGNGKLHMADGKLGIELTANGVLIASLD